MSNIELCIYGSACCKADLVKLPKTIVKKTEPGVTAYFYNKCFKCNEICDSELLNVFDSFGVEIKHGDIVECPEVDIKSAWRYHAAFNRYGLEIRDLGHNNIGMYNFHGKYINIGPYYRHLNKLSDEDLEHYWDTNREDAQKLLEKEQELAKQKNVDFREIQAAMEIYFKDLFKDIK